jgi:hypothetical protein
MFLIATAYTFEAIKPVVSEPTGFAEGTAKTLKAILAAQLQIKIAVVSEAGQGFPGSMLVPLSRRRTSAGCILQGVPISVGVWPRLVRSRRSRPHQPGRLRVIHVFLVC